MKMIYISKWQMDQAYILHRPMSDNHLGFKVADGPDHRLSCYVFYPIVAVVWLLTLEVWDG